MDTHLFSIIISTGRASGAGGFRFDPGHTTDFKNGKERGRERETEINHIFKNILNRNNSV